MANLGSNSTPISGESFDLPSGWSFEENADGEVVITDSGGTTIGRRDETNGEWVFDSISVNTLEAGDSVTANGTEYLGNFATKSDLPDPSNVAVGAEATVLSDPDNETSKYTLVDE